MLERIVENWLTNASERSFQLPFCYTLENKGHKILHLTRHRPIEFGKDVITQDSEGNYHAYQLKQGNITQRVFTELLSQLNQLCYLNLAHPHVPKEATYIPYLVTNGKVDEEVYRELEDFNAGLEAAGRPKLQILKYDDLYTDFLSLGANLWPSELSDYKNLIEFTILDGRNTFETEKFISLLEHQLELSSEEAGKIKNLPSSKRSITSSALLTAFAVSNYLNKDNHVAVIECWTIYISQILALVDKLELNIKDFRESIDIAKTIIYQSLLNLLEELDERDDLFEGDIVFDKPFYQYRATKVVGLISALYLWLSLQDDVDNEILEVASNIIEKFIDECRINTEAHLPFFLSTFWAVENMDINKSSDDVLETLITTIISCSKNGDGLPNPYYREKDLMPNEVQNILQAQITPVMTLGVDPIDDNFQNTSFYLLGIVHLLVRRGKKEVMKNLWPNISYFNFKHFQVEKEWHFYKWRNAQNGREKGYLPKRTKSWEELKVESNNYDKNQLPEYILEDPIFALFFLLFFPHRVSPDYLKHLDSAFKVEPKENGV